MSGKLAKVFEIFGGIFLFNTIIKFELIKGWIEEYPLIVAVVAILIIVFSDNISKKIRR